MLPGSVQFTKQEIEKLANINQQFADLCSWVNAQRDLVTASRLLPIVDDLTRLLIEIKKKQLQA